MGDQGLILNITDGPVLSYKGAKHFPKPEKRGSWKSKAQKRKSQDASEGPSSKRSAPSASADIESKDTKSKPNKKLKSDSTPKKGEKKEDGTKGRAAVKTSSLFKNNPEVPEIERSKVKQLQENVFSTDSFSELELHPHLVATISNVLNITQMTSVQKMTIPALLSGRDALVRSQTGSGKTLAYGVPLVQSLQAATTKIQRSDGPYALVLVPTRELALQSFTTIQKLLKPFSWIVPGVLMGGEKRKSEKARLRKGINILISTPGRLVDHIKSTKSIHFTLVRWLIVDEADRILDLGFQKDVTTILNALNSQSQQRQNVLLSATLSQGVARLADISLQNPVNVTVTEDSPAGVKEAAKPKSTEAGDDSASFALPENLHQHIVVVPSKLKLVTLSAFILGKWKCDKKPKMIIFFPSCDLVGFYYKLLSSVLPIGGSKPDSRTFLQLHGNMEQGERTEVFQHFTEAKAGILLCTDVAARGLDLPQVTWIVQYNAPATAAEYIHRVGRTARIGAMGSSLLILIPSEADYMQTLVGHKICVSEMKMEEVLSNLLLEDFLKIKRVGGKAESADPQTIRERATVLQTKFEDYIHASPEAALWAKKALQSYIRSYATYPKNLKHIFHVRSLHLGHVAKSFGLRDAPHKLSKQLAGSSKKYKKDQHKRADGHKLVGKKTNFSDLIRSEYSSGFTPKSKKNKKPKNEDKET
ncbi:probable ATP-dependent RNA helicase DDX31 isoform X2 [Rana temporaria]|uniref:probable ATP-dependent RNA helicase DDX31 isoform X2 n=1 Tax=Rana temporaria TaxID=8407 RepID=UPI001AAC633F|nr:probable ATP-dependent RNA helicase DDX31 isoform X2 [Rana temporaria]